MSAILAVLAGSSSAFNFVDVVTGNIGTYDLRSRAVSAGWSQLVPLLANVKVNPGVLVSGSSSGNFALDTGTTAYPAGSRLTIDTQGAYVVGHGGYAGHGGGLSGFTPTHGYAGGPGGPAVRVNLPTTWIGAGGYIGGGGGGGGGGQGIVASYSFDGKTGTLLGGGGGGGGAGRTGNWGVAGGPGGPIGGVSYPAGGGAGGASAWTGGGGGGAPGVASHQGASVSGGWGGAGGSWGAGGGGGGTGSINPHTNITTVGPFGAGSAGAAIVGYSNITWASSPTILGSIS